MEKEIECTIHGSVQGVGFRAFVRDRANELGISGTVRNNPEGSVEVLAQGEEEKLRVFIQLLKKGPFFAKVRDVDVEWFEKPQDTFTGFSIE